MSHLGEKDFTSRLDYIKAQSDLIQKGLYGGLPCEDLIMKGGEGSRGGKVIGHTKSGKPIYDSASHSSHKDFTSEDHDDAADHHFNEKKKTKSNETEKYAKHDTMQKEHEKSATELKESEKDKVEKSEDSDIQKAFQVLGLDISKGGPGSGRKLTLAQHKNTPEYLAAKKSTLLYQLVDPQLLSLQKAVEFDIMKGGEGSKGGKVTGHTKSGKPIYEQHKHESHRSFSVEDHKDAIKLHRELAQKHFDVVNKTTSSSVKKKNNDSAYGHNEQANRHEREVNKKEKEAQHKVGDKVKASDLKKAYEVLGLGDLIEKAEGSRGGKVIGHTKSGKPIYEEKNLRHYKNFTSQDHKDAANFHIEEHSKIHNNNYKGTPGLMSSPGKQSEEKEAQMKKHREGMEYHEMHEKRSRLAELSDNKREMANKEKSK